jgi:hypothetical protein
MSGPLDFIDDGIPFIMEGQVVATDDPDQMGRCKLWVPTLDGENFDIDSLPWAEYASPFAGFTVEYPTSGVANQSQVAYGMWAIPKIGATVLVFCLNANPSVRFYFASTLRLHRNRSLPAGRNADDAGNPGPFGDSEDDAGQAIPIQPEYNNLREQFDGKMTTSQAKTRGGVERQAAQNKTNKDGTDGYANSPVDSYLDPQTYCIVTPGRHAIIMQDDPKGSRMRFKTGRGHQVIFDDTNERIYVSTARGKAWMELDEDGHFHVFGAESISLRSGKDINLTADGSINLEAGKNINVKALTGNMKVGISGSFHLKANKDIKQSACGVFDIDSESSIKVTAASNMELKAKATMIISSSSDTNISAGGDIKQSGASIQLNGPPAAVASDASCPDLPDSPSVIPGHEPWTRPVTSGTRGANWKE